MAESDRNHIAYHPIQGLGRVVSENQDIATKEPPQLPTTLGFEQNPFSQQFPGAHLASRRSKIKTAISTWCCHSGWLRGCRMKHLPLTNPEVCRDSFEALMALLVAYRFVDVIQH